jgi:hypothetical protein
MNMKKLTDDVILTGLFILSIGLLVIAVYLMFQE